MQEESKYLEHWEVIVNKHSYMLNPKQSDILKKAIADGQKGIVLFDNFAINIVMIQEFFLHHRELNPKYVLPRGDNEPLDKDSEEYKRVREKLSEIRQKLKQKLVANY